ncbi:MAG TPA: hypothetical protein VEV20_08210, partial [Burkholderiales bacterium]|nr:hypothetical protein [Burkholderiales bacterium]
SRRLRFHGVSLSVCGRRQLTCLEHGQYLLAGHARHRDFDAARQHDEQITMALAGLRENIAGFHLHLPAVCVEARKL